MYRLKSNFVMKDVEDGLLIIDITKDKRIYHFNDFGGLILKNIGNSKNEIIEKALNKYDVKKNKISKDIDKFIKILIKCDIVEVTDEK